MRIVSQRGGRPRWLVGVFIVLTLSLLGLAATQSSAALGTTDISTTNDLEIGENDFRISDMGSDGGTSTGARRPQVAYNSTDNEYLAVWVGQDEPNGPFTIYAQRIDAATGEEVGENDIRVSQIGNDDEINDLFFEPGPDVAYNSSTNQYLVVWGAEISQGSDLPSLYGIYGQRLDAATGDAVGDDDFRIDEDAEPDDSDYRPSNPAVTYNSTDDEYFVVWQSNLAEDRSFEIVGQRLSSTGTRVGTNEFFISDMGPEQDEDRRFNAEQPSVAYNPTDNEYMVVWSGDDNIAPLVDNAREIFGQRLAGATGTEVGDNDFRISTTGPDGNIDFNAFRPAVAYNSTASEYLVAWSGGFDSEFNALEYKIFIQQLSAAGEELGGDVLISMEEEVIGFWADYPSAVYNPTDNEYMVIWSLENIIGGPEVDREYEVYGQRLDGTTGAEVGDDNFRVSDMGPEEERNYKPFDAAIAYNSRDNEYLAVWSGDDDIDPSVGREREIFGQRLDGQPEPPPTPTPTDPPATATPTATPPSATPTPTPEVPPVDSTFLPLIIR
ncbi:MAG: hypothetical protein AAGF95_21505 [Chloroflexota bacterium]